MIIFDDEGALSAEATSMIERCRVALGTFVSQHKWITATPVLVGSESMAAELVELGAERVLAIGCAEGVRHDPLSEEITAKVSSHCLNLSFVGDMMDGIRGGEGALDELDEESLTLIDDFDPTGAAIALRTIFSSSDHLAGRRVFGARPPLWQALEDKTIIDDFWDRAGVKRVASLTVRLTMDDLCKAYSQLNQGSGVVIAGDSKSGFHGGASRTRWARSTEHLGLILIDLLKECDRARVMPYLEGVSCSMHGWVFPNGEIVSLRPCEMLVSHSERETYFDYHGAASYWRPNETIHQEMRQAVESTAALLHSDYQYRGAFTVDGVATAEGFYPTELNPRFGGALGRMSAALPQLPLLTMHYASVEGHDVGLSPMELRELVIKAAEAKPIVRGMIELEITCQEPLSFFYQREGDLWRECEESEAHIAQAKWGKAIRGSLIFLYLQPESLTPYQPTIGLVSELLLTVKRRVLTL